MSSKLGSVNTQQWIKGLLVAVCGAVLGAIGSALQNGIVLDKTFWITTGSGTLVALVAYLKATLLTGENGNPLTNK